MIKDKNIFKQGLAIEASGLVKSFGNTKAVDNIDLSIPQGMVYGFLGPNGAGKTTTIRMLATLLKPDAGKARVLGFDIIKEADAVRQRIGLTGQFAAVDEDISGVENLILIARLLGFTRRQAKERSEELLNAFGLGDALKRQVKKYSGGMRRRLDIAASIVISPELLFLDEPTTGLDPRSRNQVWDIIRTLVKEGTTVLLTTQYLDEADQLADRIAVIDQGRIIAEGTSGELKASIGKGVLFVRLLNAEKRPLVIDLLKDRLGTDIQPGPDPVSLTASVSDIELITRVLGELHRSDIGITDFSLGQPSLDEVFLALTGHNAGESKEV